MTAWEPVIGLEVHAQLLTASDHHTPTPPGDWIDVTMLVTLITNPPQRHACATHGHDQRTVPIVLGHTDLCPGCESQ